MMLTNRFYKPFLLMLFFVACQNMPEVTTPTSPAVPTTIPLPTATPAVAPTHPPAEPVPAPFEQNLTPIEQVGGQIRAVVADEEYIYFNRGSRLIKYSHAHSMALVKSDILPVLPHKLYLLDNMVYAQMSDQTLWAFTVGEQWQMVGMLALPAGVREIVTAGGELHIHSQPDETTSQLDSYNSQLQFLRSLSLPPYTAVEDYPRLYQVTAQEISLANAQESSVTFTPLTGFDFSVFEGFGAEREPLLNIWTFANSRAYFINSTQIPYALTVYEIVDNQLMPQTTFGLGSDLFITGIEVIESQVYVITNLCEGSSCQGRLTLYDLETSTQPFVDEAMVSDEILDMVASGSTPYLLTEGMLHIGGMINGEIAIVPFYTSTGQTSDLLLWNKQLWVKNSTQKADVYDLTRPGELLRAFEGVSYEESFVVRGHFYGQDDLGKFYTVEAPQNEGEGFTATELPYWPHMEGGIGGLKSWLVQDNVAAGLDYAGMQFVEIVSPLEVRAAGQYPGQFETVIWQENIMALQTLTSNGSQISLLDVADRTNIQLLSVTEDLGTPLAFYGDYLYLYHDEFLSVVDISNPQKPDLWHQVVLPAPLYGFKVQGTVGYGWGNDLWVFDLSDPAQPRLTAHAPTAGVVSEVVVVDQTIYVADGFGGLLVFKR